MRYNQIENLCQGDTGLRTQDASLCVKGQKPIQPLRAQNSTASIERDITVAAALAMRQKCGLLYIWQCLITPGQCAHVLLHDRIITPGRHSMHAK